MLYQSIRVAEKITQKVEGQLSKSQKEYLLRQQVCFHNYISSVRQFGCKFLDVELEIEQLNLN